MARLAGTHELGLFAASSRRRQPRDAQGRFMRVRYSAERLLVLQVAREMRARLGLPWSPWLEPYGGTRNHHDDGDGT